LNGKNTKYTKDYIQLSKKAEFLGTVSRLFPVAVSGVGSVPLTYRWPDGTTPGTFVFNSADRPHLKWETTLRAPRAWKMSLTPSEATAETIPGDPSHLDFDSAEKELALLTSRGAGQPYLLAIKLRDEPRTLHLRAYLANPKKEYAWADLRIALPQIQALATRTSRRQALNWETFRSGGVVPSAQVQRVLSRLITSANPMSVIESLDPGEGRDLATYLRDPGYGLFFDSTRNHDAWLQPAPISEQIAASADEFVKVLDTRFPPATPGDAVAETLDAAPDEVEAFRKSIEHKSFGVPDSTATVKTRGSAQRAFADAVKSNYGFQCAITGITSRDFLVAAHVVPWSEDESIRLDPSNGICLSLIMDRAFEKGYLLIEDDLTIRMNCERVGDDAALKSLLEPYDGKKLRSPAKCRPKKEYLDRRRTLVGCDWNQTNRNQRDTGGIP